MLSQVSRSASKALKNNRAMSTIVDKVLANIAAKTSVRQIAAPAIQGSLAQPISGPLSTGSFEQKRSFFSSAPKANIPTDEEVKDLFYLWNDALATLDPTTVAKRYAKQAILLPTVSDTPRTTYDLIHDYFTAFTKLQPQGVILESNVLKGDGWALDAGIYEFTLGASGAKVKARYTFQYVFEDGEWKISHHHSSVMPEGIPKAEAITEQEVKDLFYLWNDALATLDPDTVAKRYSKEAVLLPTVSDTPRTNYDLIQDYFTAFLQKKPQGVILESNVLMGFNWAQDAGIYEFTMGSSGDKVKARYTFVYVFEDGEWKISHHHSSVMPESILG